MPRPDDDQQIVVSIFNRLLAGGPAPTGRARNTSLAELRVAVRNDLEALLNSRPRCIGWPADLTELDVSSINYGIPDFASFDIASGTEREAFRAEVERIIQKFEPRFRSVSVTLLDNAEGDERTLRMRIEAVINIDPAPEPLIFDSSVEPTTQAVQVAARHG